MNKIIVVDKMEDALNIAKNTFGIAKGTWDAGVKIVKASEDLVCRAVAFACGLLIGALFSKTLKKIAWVIAILAGVGAAYIIYNRFKER